MNHVSAALKDATSVRPSHYRMMDCPAGVELRAFSGNMVEHRMGSAVLAHPLLRRTGDPGLDSLISHTLAANKALSQPPRPHGAADTAARQHRKPMIFERYFV